MKVALCTLCLNESEFIQRNYDQHKDWPGLCAWVFVEASDPTYAQASPEMVASDGLSIDGTSQILRDIRRQDSRVAYFPYGRMGSKHYGLDNLKSEARNIYLGYLDEAPVKPDIFVVVDADEFYTLRDQVRIVEHVKATSRTTLCWRYRQRHIWRPPSIAASPLFRYEVVGGYWDVPHTRVFRWTRGIRYRRNHNWPEGIGYYATRRLIRSETQDNSPQCIHLGFARSALTRTATNRYYRQRGETVTRPMYVDCRSAWETWQPEDALPAGASVLSYFGDTPECFQEQS